MNRTCSRRHDQLTCRTSRTALPVSSLLHVLDSIMDDLANRRVELDNVTLEEMKQYLAEALQQQNQPFHPPRRAR